MAPNGFIFGKGNLFWQILHDLVGKLDVKNEAIWSQPYIMFCLT